jgi:outer membrane protein assembly factor BamC
VLPESRNVHLEQNGTQRWLVVEDTAENVWPVVKTFWSENGFVIKTDNPQAGLIETDWAENRAKIPKGGLRSLLGKVFDDLYDSGERDMYSTRLERGADNKSTRIYISHYGKVEVQSADKTTFQWVPRDHNPELEATMLQLLMTKLGGTAAQAEAQAATAQAQAVAAQSAPPAPKLQTSATGTETILLGEPFDKSWHKVGQALEHAGLNIEDRDRANGIYYLNAAPAAKEKSWFSKLAFWSKDDTKPLRYQVTVHEEDAGCTVAVNNGNGESNADTQRIVDTLYKALSAQ